MSYGIRVESILIMDKVKKLGPATDSLNKALSKALENFSYNTEWTDINNWLLSLEAIFRDNPSPFIIEKLILSKRLNQCINPILPDKVHECVLRVHQLIFMNMRGAVEDNINEYVKLFATDLGIYSLSILPYFTHTSVTEHRIMVLNLLNDYYLDLGRELIPMLMGFMKALLPVYSETNEETLHREIEKFMNRLLKKAGRRYVISTIWSSILRFTDCRPAGMKFLGKMIDKMEFIKEEEEYESSHGFSEEEEEVRKELERELAQINHEKSLIASQEIIDAQQPEQLGELPVTPFPRHNSLPPQPGSPVSPEPPISPDGSPTRAEQHQRRIIRSNTFDLMVLPHIREASNEDDHLEEEGHPKHEGLNNKNGSQVDLMNRMQNSQGPRDFMSGQASESHDSIKLNKVPLMLTPGIELIKDGIDSNSNENNYPHHNTLVVNSLIACLEDDSQFIKRAALDFMFSHLRLKSSVLDDNDKQLLVEAVMRLFKKKEISITKRVNRWLLGKENEENVFEITEKNKFVLPFIVEAFKKILSFEPTAEETCILPLKIVQNFYMEHSNLLESTVSEISIDILRYIYNFGSSGEFSAPILKAGNRFFSNIPSHYPRLFTSLGKKFIEGVQSEDDRLAFESVKYLDYCYIKLMHHEHGIEELDYITITLQLLSEGLNLFSVKHGKGKNFYRTYLRDAILLVCNLLSRREGVQKFMRKEKEAVDKQYLQDTGKEELPPERIKYQQEIQQQEEQQRELYLEILQNIESFFMSIGNIIKNSTIIQAYEDIYRLSSLAMVKVQYQLPRSTKIDEIPRWFVTIEQGIRVSSPSISLSAIEAMIKCLMYEDRHPIYAQFKKFIMDDKNKKNGSDYQHLALQKLWALLDYPHMHGKIIDLIVAFSKFFPYEFTETVKRSFQTHNDPEKEASIQRFSHFWRLTGFKYKDLLLSNREFAELNKVGLFKMLDFLDDQNPLVRHAAKNWMMESLPLFHRVLEPLFYELMKVCGDWYTTPKGMLIIRNTYDTSLVFSTFRRLRSLLSNGTYSFLRYIYQTSISASLEELREKVTPITQTILTEATAEATAVIMESMEQKEPVLPKHLEAPERNSKDMKDKSMAYIDMLIILGVKFVQGLALESMGIDFYTGNSGVNTSAIQLLESMINYIDSPELCYKLINFLMQPLTKVLNESIQNKEYITQIQLLNLFRTVLFSSSFRKKGKLEEVRAFFKSVFTQNNFLSGLLSGLHTPFSYVRGQFISFISTCVPLIADFLDPLQCTEAVKSILFTYYRIIKEIRISLIEEVLEDEQERNIVAMRESEHDPNMNKQAKIQEKEDEARKEQKLVKLSNNLHEMAKTGEILSVLHGLSSILNYFYDFDKLTPEDMKFEFSNPYTFFDSLRTIVSLGFSSRVKNGKLIEKTQFLHNMETCISILNDLSPVYETLVRAWPLSEEFVRIATEEFSSIGSRIFNFEKFSAYNRVLRDLISYVDREKESIWGKIFSIMQPMFYKFPREITEIYLKLWVRDCTDVVATSQNPHDPMRIKASIANTEFLMKNVETIIVSAFPMSIIIHAFLETNSLEEIFNYYEKAKKSKSTQALNPHICRLEAKLLYFLYVYFMYTYIDETSLTKDRLLEIWSIILKSIKPFLPSESPTTAMWILDIINMCATKYSPKEILVNEKFKSDLHGIVNQALKYIASVAAKTKILFYEDPTKAEFDTSPADKFKIVLPLCPTLYEIYKGKPDRKSDIEYMLFQAVRAGDCPSIDRTMRLWCFKILKHLGYKVLQNTYLNEKTHFAVIRAVEWMEIILPTVEDKSSENMIYAESASEVLHDLLSDARILFIKPLRASIIRIFNKDDFFICNKSTLIYWAQIIDWLVSSDRNNETFSEYLAKVSLSSSYFSSESSENKKRIKSFERICFILYSGQTDKYAQKIKGLLEKIADVIKMAESAHPALLILILFSIRILMLRLSELSLNQLFLDIWPMLLTFLMQIFSKKFVKLQLANQISNNPNLLLAALKLIEMTSLTNLNEFAHHQWVFVFDYFGVKISQMEVTTEISTILSNRPELTELMTYEKAPVPSPFYYKPYLMGFLEQHSIKYVPEERNRNGPKEEYEPRRRKIIVKDSFVQSEEEVKVYVHLLAQYLAHLNEFRVKVDMKDVEEVIINDFIKLDSFIHKI